MFFFHSCSQNHQCSLNHYLSEKQTPQQIVKVVFSTLFLFSAQHNTVLSTNVLEKDTAYSKI